MIPRIGIGYDVHPFAADRPLVLGGVTLPHETGLAGHSDADALAHAVADAILGALALGDLGVHFPDTDPDFAGANSLDLLGKVAVLAADRGYVTGNVDATVVTEAPKLAPAIADMRLGLAKALRTRVDQVSVKATRPEGLGSLGRREGLLAIAVVLMVEKGVHAE